LIKYSARLVNQASITELWILTDGSENWIVRLCL
jgi:hypothetical protein